MLRRAHARRRRRPAACSSTATCGVDPAARRAPLGGAELALTAREFDLLAFLLAHPGRAFTRAELLAQVWGWEFGDQSTVTVHVRRLREKIEPDPTQPRRIATIWGTGYRYDPRPVTVPMNVLAELARAAPLALLFSLPVAAGRRAAAAPDAPALGHRRDDRAGAGAARRPRSVGVLGGQRLHVHPAAGRHGRGRAWWSPR